MTQIVVLTLVLILVLVGLILNVVCCVTTHSLLRDILATVQGGGASHDAVGGTSSFSPPTSRQ